MDDVEEIKERVVLGNPSAVIQDYLAFYESNKIGNCVENPFQNLPELKYNCAVLGINDVHSSSTPLDHLYRTSVDNLFMKVPNKGTYLLLRTIKPALQRHIVLIQTLVEDHLGNVISLIAKNFTDPELNLTPEVVLPIGTVLAVKEPFVDKSPNGNYLKTDSPSDIVIINRQHKMYDNIRNVEWFETNFVIDPIVEPMTGDDWTARGDELVEQKNYVRALEAYLVSLKYTNSKETKASIHIHIAALYLCLGYFEYFLNNIMIISSNDQENRMKFLFCAGQTSYKLGWFREAKEYFEKFLTLDKDNLKAVKQLDRCVRRLQEWNGDINIPKLFTSAANDPETRLSCANYIGPLEIIVIPGKGKGVIATIDIVPGTLLSVYKALAITADDSPFKEMILTAMVIQKVFKNPKTCGTAVYNLTTNDSEMDSLKTYCNETTKKEPIVDALRIKKIVMANAIELDAVDEKGIGLFLFPSFLNHSCVPNAFWNVYNDVMVIHALQPIERIDEVVISYWKIEPDYLIRQEKIKSRGFQCNCALCRLDRRIPSSVLRRIGALIKESDKLSEVNSSKLKSIIEEMEYLYQSVGREKMRVPLMFLYHKLAKIYLKEGNYSQVMVPIAKAFESFGLNLDQLLESASKESLYLFPDGCGTYACSYISDLLVTAIHLQLRLRNETLVWGKLLRMYESVCNGANGDMVKEKYMSKKFP